MSYIKREFSSGDTLYADDLNAMDEQIYKLSEEIGDLKWSDLGEKTETSVLCDGSYLFEDADGLGVFGFSVNDENITIENGGNTYVVTIDGTTYTVIGEYSTETEPPSDGMFSEDGQFTLMVSDGSLSLIDFSATEPTTKSVKIVKFKTEVTKVPNKYLDILETVGGDTLTWDGNTEGRDVFEGALFKVSDLTPIIDELTSYTVTGSDGTVFSSADMPAVEDGGLIFIGGELAAIVSSDDIADELGITRGIYFIRIPNDDGTILYTTSLTINGYTGFTKEVVKEECLPSVGNLNLYSTLDDKYLYKDIGLTTKVTANELMTFADKNSVKLAFLVNGEIMAYYMPIMIGGDSSTEYRQFVCFSGISTNTFYTAEYTAS